MKIRLYPFHHRNSLQIGIEFPFSQEVKDHLKEFPGVKWSQTHRCYYIEYSLENQANFFEHLRKKQWYVDYSELKKVKPESISEKSPSSTLDHKTFQLFKEYKEYLMGKRYSESTIRTYCNFIMKFLEFQSEHPKDLIPRDIERFVEKNIAEKGYSISTHRQCISALTHFFTLFQVGEIDPENIARPAKSKYLPGVLSKEEIIDLLRATRNLKHRAILALIYSSGLRIGELLKLKLKDIDIDRRQVKINMAKGRKDRYSILAESFLPLLFNYMSTYKPKVYFVEGQNGGMYTASAVRSFLKESCLRAGITKRVTPHSLRHSYATHMLENGIDIRYIQELLGHSRPETTMIYTHVAQKDLSRIKSPLDVMLKELSEKDKGDPNLRLSRKFLD